MKHNLAHCARCDDTGKVPRFPGVRVPCPIDSHHGPGCLCGGRGWTASLDFVTWCWALHAVGYYVNPAWSPIWPGQNIHGQAPYAVYVLDVEHKRWPAAERLLSLLAERRCV